MSLWLVVLAAIPTGAAGAAPAADVTIDFLSDGRCAVAATGEGFRSNATYRPDTPPEQGERRCAMPPVPPGRTVSLKVSLPSGGPRPGRSTPPLSWAESAGTWVGRASLTSWPDAVVVSPPPRWRVLPMAAVLALLIGAIGFGMRRGRVPPRQAADVRPG